MNELTKIKDRILGRITTYTDDLEKEGMLTINKRCILEGINLIIDSEFTRETNTQLHTEHIIKSTIKEYLDKPHDDVTELLLELSADLCERIRKENENGL